jgi:biopolymer transport protein ExbD
MRVARRKRLGPLISMTPMIDVLFILLVFFMVTSTFLDLDMIPLIGGARPGPQSPAQSSPKSSPAPPAPREPAPEFGSLLVRLGADGRTYVAGQAVDPAALTAMVSLRLAVRPSTPIMVLPSGSATTQSLVSLMDALTRAGARDVRVVRFEAQ